MPHFHNGSKNRLIFSVGYWTVDFWKTLINLMFFALSHKRMGVRVTFIFFHHRYHASLDKP